VARDTKSIRADLRQSDLRKANQRTSDAMRRRLREAAFLLLLPLVVYLFACLASYNPQDPGWSHASASGLTRNIGGAVGAWAADLSFYLLIMGRLGPVAARWRSAISRSGARAARSRWPTPR